MAEPLSARFARSCRDHRCSHRGFEFLTVEFCSAQGTLLSRRSRHFWGTLKDMFFCLQQLVEARRLHFSALHFSAIEFGKPATKKW
jgi:hypothetical protein